MNYDIDVIDIAPTTTLVVQADVPADGIAAFLNGAFSESADAARRQGLTFAGPPFGRYHRLDDGGFQIEAGFPVEGTPRPAGRVLVGSLPGGRVAQTVHRGPYETVDVAYGAVTDWLGDRRMVATGEPWESYLDEPGVSAPRTLIRFPVG